MNRTNTLLMVTALAWGGAAGAGLAAGSDGAKAVSAPRQYIRIAQAPQVRTKKAPASQGTPNVRAKTTLVCEGGKMQTMSDGKKSCICPPGVNRIAVTDTHFRCDRPQVRSSKSTGEGPEKRGPRAKATAGEGKPVGKPASTGKPVPGADTGPGKSVKECGDPISSTRLAAVTRKGGSLTAQAGWALAVRKRYPSGWGNWNNAKDRSTKCEFAGTWNCTATARPCEP